MHLLMGQGGKIEGAWGLGFAGGLSAKLVPAKDPYFLHARLRLKGVRGSFAQQEQSRLDPSRRG